MIHDHESGYSVKVTDQRDEQKLFRIIIVITILNQPRLQTEFLCRRLLEKAQSLYEKAKE